MARHAGDDYDPDDDSLRGTGKLLGTIGPIELWDDGDPDPYISYKLPGYPDVDSVDKFRHLRYQLGDAEFKRLLDESDDSSSTSSTPSAGLFEQDRRPAFKCVDCNRTWPRSKNDGTDRCPECGTG